MLQSPHPKGYLPDDKFKEIYSTVPRLNVDLVIRATKGPKAGGFLLCKRSIEPYKGQWHMPGGTVYIQETLADAAIRIAKAETSLTVVFKQLHGFLEFPHEKRMGTEMHTVSAVVEVVPVGAHESDLHHDENASAIEYFTIITNDVLPQHADFLKELYN